MNLRQQLLTDLAIVTFIAGNVLLIRPTLAEFYSQTSLPQVRFEEVTRKAGLAYIGAQYGASWGDYNGDNWPDLFVNNHFQDNPHLYKNNHQAAFFDTTVEAGVIPPTASRDMHGSSWGDFDNDGDLDLYIVTNGNSLNLLHVNQGNQQFREQAEARGVSDLAGRGRTASWMDYNQDGLLDLFVANQGTPSDKLYKNKGDGTFEDVSTSSGLDDNINSTGNVWGDYDNDGHLDLVRTGGPLRLHRNNGDGTFTDVTDSSLLGNLTNTTAADFGDYNNDGDLDLYVTRGDSHFFSHVAVATNAITFTFEGLKSLDGFEFISSHEAVTFDPRLGGGGSMPEKFIFIGKKGLSPAIVPFTLDSTTQHYGKPSFTAGVSVGVFIWQDGPDSTWHLQISNIEESQGQVRTQGSFTQVVTLKSYDYTAPPRENYLFKNQGNGTFKEVGAAAGVNSPESSTAGSWADYNNDGWLDLYVVNSGDVRLGSQLNQLFHNNHDGTFTNVAQSVGLETQPLGLDDCAAWADYDRNGFLDLFVTNVHQAGNAAGPRKLYRNLGNNNHWLAIKLVGVSSNRQGVGARVTLQSGNITQTREMNNGAHYHCQNSSMLHFGLGRSNRAEHLTINWPGGQTQLFQNVRADQLVIITEGEGLAAPALATSYLPIILK